MNLKEKIDQELIEALKAKDELKTSTLRMAKAAIKNKEIALRQTQGKQDKELDDNDVSEVLAKEIKQRKDSIEEYKKGNRPELVEKETKEIAILSPYLPEQLSEEEITKIITEAITKTNASGPQDMGKVMGMVMPQLKGKAEGSLVSKIVKEKLQG